MLCAQGEVGKSPAVEWKELDDAEKMDWAYMCSVGLYTQFRCLTLTRPLALGTVSVSN